MLFTFRVLSCQLAEEFLSLMTCAGQGQVLQTDARGILSLSWNLLGFERDFMQGSMILSVEDYKRDCFVIVFVEVSNHKYIRLIIQHRENCEQGFSQNIRLSHFQGQE